eukprot:Sspe_Gene.16986::Locus_6021_Transcript_1_1_Confidence_1.000_Length_2445::g.16986::m.16986/K02148/ATPeV1C, ATP6C; V-type H+-transporting ATPase subunit C
MGKELSTSLLCRCRATQGKFSSQRLQGDSDSSTHAMTEYFLVMVPFQRREETTHDSSKEYKDLVQKLGFRSVRPSYFPVPPLKVGTLDTLIECSDELAKVDPMMENTIAKILSVGEQLAADGYMPHVEPKNRISELLVVRVADRDRSSSQPEVERKASQYLQSWRWDDYKYPLIASYKNSIKLLINDMMSRAVQAEEVIKKRNVELGEMKVKAQAAEKRAGGNLAQKDITAEIEAWNKRRKIPMEILCNKKDESQLGMLFVAVPSRDLQEWNSYASWGIRDEDIRAMEEIKDGQTDHQADAVSLCNFQFRYKGKDVPMDRATASNKGGSQHGCTKTDTGLPENAIDGRLETQWIDINQRSLEIDFGAPTPVDEFAFTTNLDAPYRDPVQWVLEGYIPAEAGKEPPSVTVNIQDVGPLKVQDGESEAEVMARIAERVKVPLGKQLKLKESGPGGLGVTAVYSELEEGATYVLEFQENRGGYSTTKKEIDLGKWVQVHGQNSDADVPKERRTRTPWFRLSGASPKGYVKYRFTPKLMRGKPERGPIPCGNGAVPGSSETVAGGPKEEYCLMSVMIFMQMEQNFRNLCRDRKFIVRQYEPSEFGDSQNPHKEAKKLEEDRDRMSRELLNLVKVQFSEAFSAWVHVKAIRGFVEAVLRYGLPANYVGMFFAADQKQQQEMRAKLEAHYAHLKPKGFDLADEANDTSALQERYPYVSLRIHNFE